MGFVKAMFVVFALLILLSLPRIQHLVAYRVACKRRGCFAPPPLPFKDPIFGLDNVLADLRQRKGKRKVRTLYETFQRPDKTVERYPFCMEEEMKQKVVVLREL
jgi:hypothetical protein